MSVLDSVSLSDLLKVRDDGDAAPPLPRRGGASNTLAYVIASEKREAAGGGGREGGDGASAAAARTLIDIIRDEEGTSDGGGRSGGAATWRIVRSQLVRRTGSPAAARSDPSSFWRGGAETSPTAVRSDPSAAVAAARAPDAMEAGEGSGSAIRSDLDPPPPSTPRMSLMALLEQTDRHVAGVGACLPATAAVVVAEEEEGGKEGKPASCCCVCMVRTKGAAFIPCGHTFCRVCSRELRASRGKCPLCNVPILEILDIF